MLYRTTEDVYRSFLREIKKANTAVVPPAQFNLLMGDAESLFYREKSSEIEKDQKRIDDLKEWIVITDGLYEYNGSPLNPILADGQTNIFPLPKDATNNYECTVSTMGVLVYPAYRRLLKVEFRYRRVNDPCYPDGLSPWIGGKPLKANEQNVIAKNPFRKPNSEVIYYKEIGNNIKLWLGDDTQNYGYEMRIEYIKYPRPFNYSVVPADNVMLELQSDQIHEIVKIAARLYMGESSDPRYRVAVSESVMTAKGK